MSRVCWVALLAAMLLPPAIEAQMAATRSRPTTRRYRHFSVRGVADSTLEFAEQRSVPIGASAAVGGQGGQAGTAGTLGFQQFKENDSFFSVWFNMGDPGTQTGTQEDFGWIVLNPGINMPGLQVGGFMLSPKLRIKRKLNGGIMYRFGGAFTTWQQTWFRGALPDTIKQSEKGLIMHGALGLHFESPVRAADTINVYQYGIELAPAFRVIGSNVAQNDSLLIHTLGTRKKAFWGGEVTLFARLNEARPFLRLTWFKSDTTVRSLSGFQGYLGLDVASSLFKSQ